MCNEIEDRGSLAAQETKKEARQRGDGSVGDGERAVPNRGKSRMRSRPEMATKSGAGRETCYEGRR